MADTDVFGTNLSFPEGPAFLSNGDLALVEMGSARGCVSLLDGTGRKKRELARTGRPNGIVVDSNDTLWIAESRSPAILRVHGDGSVETWTRTCGEHELLWPNDLCFSSDDSLFLTDSGVRVSEFMDGDVPRAGYEGIPLDGRVCHYDLRTGVGSVIDSGLQFANGIALGPDGMLYVSETMTGEVFRYDLSRGCARELFGNVLDPAWRGDVMRGPDGMAFDMNGHLYVTVFGQGDVTVLEPGGSVARRYLLRGQAPTNIAFGPAGSRRVFVTENAHGRVESFDVGVDGHPLIRQSRG